MRHEWDLMPGEPATSMRHRVAGEMSVALENADASDVLSYTYDLFGERLAVVSSFGAESVVLLHLASQASKDIPVIFIDTQMLFEETLQYQLDVAGRLGLSDVRRISMDDVVMRLSDPDNSLHKRQPDDCCHLRKTLPLETELLSFDAWATGRKRHQTAMRSKMDIVEVDGDGRIKINPLANWTPADIAAHFDTFDLPRHPLVSKGYGSIGCAPCTSKVAPGEDPRAGRWRGEQKDECGIHFGADGTVKRNSDKAA